MAEDNSDRVRLNPDESPMIMSRLAFHSRGSRSIGPSALPSEHYVRKRNFSKYSAALKSLIPFRRKINQRTELPLDNIGFMSLVSYSWVTAFMRKSWYNSPDVSLTSAKQDSCNMNGQRLKDFLRDENVRRGQLNTRILYTAWRFVRTRVLIAAVIYIFSAAMYITALVFFLAWFLESKEIFNLLVLILLFSFSLVLHFWSNSMTFRTANRLQSAFMSVMYKHLLRVSVVHSLSAHRIVTVMATDSEKVHEAVMFLPIVLTVPIILVVSITMLLMKMNCYSVQDSVFAVFTFTLSTPIVYYLARLSNVWKSHMSLFTGKRMVSLQEMLLHIPLVKMTLREKLFHKTAEDLRTKECQYMKKMNICDGFSVSFLHILPLLVIALLWHRSNEIVRTKCDDANLFSVIILLMIPLKELLFNFWLGMVKIFDGQIALRRLKRVLVLGYVTKTSSRKPLNHLLALSINEATYVVKISNITGDQKKKHTTCACIRCQQREEDEVEMQSKNVLKNISLAARKETIIGICGYASSGKTALILAILGQINPSFGGDKFLRDGSYAYIGQNPWIMDSTLRENILFNEMFVPKKYYNVVYCCSLNDDIGVLPGGDQTYITESMLTLGQRQRIALARALYANKDIYLLDDLLSAVNCDIGLIIFERAIQNYLHEKTVIITSREVKFLKLCDQIFVLKRGEIVENGSHDELMEKECYPFLIKSYLQEKSQKQMEDIKSFTMNSNVEVVQDMIRTNSSLKIPDSLEEETMPEAIDEVLKYNDPVSFFKTMIHERHSSAALIVSLIFRIISIICIIVFPILIVKFSNAENVSYLIALVILFIILITRVVGIIMYDKVTLSITFQIHQTWIENICKCCVNIFQSAFHSEVLRWFSIHLSEFDIYLPSHSGLLLENAFLAVLLIVLLVFCSFWFLIPLVVIFLVSYYLLSFTKTALSKLYNQVEDSCLCLNGYVSSTLMGRVTIQAYGKEAEYWAEFHNRCDRLVAHFQLHKAAASWLTFWIHIISLSLMMIVLGCWCLESQLDKNMKKWMFTLNYDDSTRIISISIFCVILFGYILNNVMLSSATISAKLTVLGNHDAKIRSIKQEEDNEVPFSSKNTFTEGSIVFHNVKLEFWPDSQPSWRGLTFQVQDGEKIGVLGLPGSGKTAIIGALYKLAGLAQGSVTIGGIDITEISVEFLRSSIALIPKDPVIFSGTIRLNIDPMQKHSIRELNDSLEKVGLSQTINDLPNQLETQAHHVEGKLSTDECQLLYVAQAVLRNPKIIILEEPTQPIGAKNMFKVQDIVCQLFHCTILIVANNVKFASNCDKIIIVKDGQVAEFDTPQNLFRSPNSCFSQMLFSDSDTSFETEV